eukprot:4310427-Pyramimonas_sp.AAC.1
MMLPPGGAPAGAQVAADVTNAGAGASGVGGTLGTTRAPLHAAPGPPAVLDALISATLGTTRAPLYAAPAPPAVLSALAGAISGSFRAPLHAAPAPPAVLAALAGAISGSFRAPLHAAPAVRPLAVRLGQSCAPTQRLPPSVGPPPGAQPNDVCVVIISDKCKQHGGGRRCSVQGCTTAARGGGKCSRHGTQCSEQGCKGNAAPQGVKSKCTKHGGVNPRQPTQRTSGGQGSMDDPRLGTYETAVEMAAASPEGSIVAR